MTLTFGDCVLDRDRRELRRGSSTVGTPPKVFDLLVYLLDNRERVVSRDDLLDAVWAGRIVSESTLASHVNAARKAIGDSGQRQALIRTFARKGFRFVGEVTEGPTAEHSPPGAAEPDAMLMSSVAEPPLPNKPSIAILPFASLSGDPDQVYFADGMVEDIITALSRFPRLFVIARNSSFTYKGRDVDVRQVGRELGVRYVLEGSVRKAEGRVRITGQLVDAGTRGHLWADRFEAAVDDIFDLQDRMVESIVVAILPQLERAEMRRTRRKPMESLDSYDFYLRGMASFHRGTRADIDDALSLFKSAIGLEPDFASAYGMAAWCRFWRKINGWMTDRAAEVADGVRLARRAIAVGKNDAVALTRGGHALAHLDGELDLGIALLDRSLVLNPNLVATWFLSGYLRLWRGDRDEAIERFAHAMRLSPLDTEMYRMQAGTAMAHLLAGRFDSASSMAERSFREMPSFLMVVGIIAASHAMAGRMEEARRAMRRMRQLDPALRVSGIGEWVPLLRAEDLATFAEGLRRAGLPE